MVLNAIENIESGRSISDSINLIKQVEANFERLRGGIQDNDIDNVVAILHEVILFDHACMQLEPRQISFTSERVLVSPQTRGALSYDIPIE